MADPVAIVQKIIDIAIIIKDAIEKVRENKEECRGIQKLVCRVSDVLSLLRDSEKMKHWAVSGSLDDLGDAVSRARDAVTACQGRNILCLFCKASKLFKKLGQVKIDISLGMMLVIFASHAAAEVVVLPKGQQSALNSNVFFVRTYQAPPLYKHLRSHPPAVAEGRPLSNGPSHSPDAVAGNGLGPCLPIQQPPPYYAPVIADDVANNLEPPSINISPPPHSHRKLAPIESKQPSRSPARQSPPLPSPPCITTYIPPPATPPPSPPPPPPSHSVPTYVTSQPHRPPTRPQLTPPSPAPASPNVASTDAPLAPHDSPLQSTIEVSSPVSSSAPMASGEDASDISDKIKNKPGEAEGPSPLLPGLTKFSLSELEDATQNFSKKNKIGSSDAGIFYKGVLPDRLMVAIKQFQDPPPFLLGRLSAQLRIASKLQSKDVEPSGNSTYIIRILGYGHELIWGRQECFETNIFLVEEYLPNGSMYNIIDGHQFHWTSLFHIIQGLARALHYLHEQNIVHMNVKPASVLLDSDMNPKLTDFGIARILERHQVIQDSNIAGTVGYMPPEYILEGTLSAMYDVYSFGVTLLETISSMCKTEPARHHASIPWAWKVREHQQIGELFNPYMFEEPQLTEIKRCLEIGLLCTQFEWTDRPTMSSVLEMIHGKKGLKTPRQPEYTKERVVDAKGSSHKIRKRR